LSTRHRIGLPDFLDSGFEFSGVLHERAELLINRYPSSRSALLPLLHLVQSEEGCVSVAGLQFCAQHLDLSTAEVAAVASFYTMYKRHPCGEHLVSVCTNTLCAVLGGDAIFNTLSRHLGVGRDETAGEPGTPGSITLESAECLAACDHAPVVTVDYEYYDEQSPDSALDLVQGLRRGEKPHPTRGAALTDFRNTELQIAGFFPDLVEQVDAPTASPQTLQGNSLAEDNDWQAPAMPVMVPDLPPLPEKK
jgi:NADH-quinone oxidoreductase subunit E